MYISYIKMSFGIGESLRIFEFLTESESQEFHQGNNITIQSPQKHL